MTEAATLSETFRGEVPLLADPRAESFGVTMGFTDRRGGVSAAPWDRLNLSTGVGDDESAVSVNRDRAAGALDVQPSSLRFPHQVHGSTLIRCDGSEGTSPGDADAAAADRPGITLGILTADCVPVLIVGEAGVAAAHAGWRGLVAGVIENALDAVGTVRAAWVGPSIRACCYEVGPEVIERFESAGLPVRDESHVDPGDAAKAILERRGVANVAAASVCTSCDEDHFSYRRDGVTGRQGAFIARLP
jgi:YfiH family protein